jgi:Domain of unknown function (DUF4271)
LEYSLRNIENWDWVTIILVGIFAILSITRYLYPKRFHEFLLLPLTDKFFKLQGKSYEIKHMFNALLFGVQVLSISLFIYLYLSITNPSLVEENQWLIIQISTGYTVFVLVKFLSEKIIAYIFNIESMINRYLYEKLSYTSLISLLVLTGNIVFVFIINPAKNVLIAFATVMAGLYIISLMSSFKRNWIIILRHFFYFILYLCTLEIVPYIILYRLLV